MDERPEPTDEEAARITANIDSGFDFLGDLIAEPAIAELIPTDSTIKVRTVQFGQARFRLTAYRDSDSVGNWTARITRRLPLDDAIGPVQATRPSGQRPSDIPNGAGSIQQIWAHETDGVSAEEALDRLEVHLKAALVAS